MKKAGEELFKERKKRIQDAIQLKVPDRVPIWFQDASFFPAKYVGITFEEAMFEGNKLFGAYKKTLVDFEPDMYFNPGHAIRAPGNAFEAVDCKQILLPGRGVSPLHSFQFVEGEYMKAEEYDELIDDPTDFAIRKYLPRIFGVLKPLEKLPPLKGLLRGYAAGLSLSAIFAAPEMATAFESFYRAGLMVQKHNAAAEAFNQEMEELGFPLSCGGAAMAPFDLVCDYLRGMRETFLDIYRRPEKLLAAIEKVTPLMIGSAIMMTKMSGNPGVFIPLHRGADGFMSLGQFETFYWPGLEKLILSLIDEGLTPCPFFEGSYTGRLEYLAQLPRGKVLGMFDTTDIYKAKEVIGDTMCISGLMPLSLLQTGTPEKVKAYAKKLIDVVGKGGGFIMGPKSAMDEANPELVRVWVDFTKEYGVYK